MSKACTIESHLLRHPSRPVKSTAPLRAAVAGQPAWPSFQGNAVKLGTSPGGITIYYDSTLPAAGLANAQDLLAQADSLAGQTAAIFGQPVNPCNVIVFALGGATDGTGGADHASCDFVTGADIEVDCAFGNSPMVYGLFVAEYDECCMGGNLCGYSTGEALSRWVGNVIAPPAALDPYASAPTWQQDGYPNWVDTFEPTDQDYDSIGCGMVFISWLLSKGSTISQIAQGMVKLGDNGTFAQLYQSLGYGTSTTAWTTFLAAAKAMGVTFTNDNPFAGTTVPPPPPPPPPANLQQQIDNVFAGLEQQFRRRPLVLQAMKAAQAKADALFTQQKVNRTKAAAALSPSIIAIIDAAFVEAAKDYPVLSPELQGLQALVDALLPKV